MTGQWAGVWQAASCLGFGVALAIYITLDVSGAHLNPAMTLAFRLVRPSLSWSTSLWYMAAQVFGAFVGGLVNFGIYNTTLKAFEREHDLTRGHENSILTASVFGEYFPNPVVNSKWSLGGLLKDSDITSAQAMFIEAWGTCVLVFIFFAMTHYNNKAFGDKQRVFLPFMVGCTVTCCVGLYGPLTMCGINPARDFGPRLAAAICGWGTVAIPGPRNGFWVYIIGPLLGGPVGAFAAEKLWSGTLGFKPEVPHQDDYAIFPALN